ncbi:MAG: peptide chain release factor 2 [Thermoleophilia bacterium]|jgi:peptide chain release factor 2|nr:peptide chain release factor 2 [Thermoleophilia bacterium]
MTETARNIEDYVEQLRDLEVQLETVRRLADPEASALRIEELDAEMNSTGFWDDQKTAAKVSAERTRAARKVEGFHKLAAGVGDVEATIELAKESDIADQQELLVELNTAIPALVKTMADLQEEALYTGEFDSAGAVVSVQAGEGGVDAQDWAEMLVRMYSRFADKRGFDVQLNEESQGEEAGIRSATFTVKGDYAYGVFNAEGGVHRLVRMSPFDSAHRRQTSFAQVEVSPLFEDDVVLEDIEIDPSDLRVDTYRASGAGGQHVNKTESAVRLTHLPTGLVTQCQNERSQHQNKDTAMKMMRGKLYALKVQEREAVVNAEKGGAQNIGFGSQIRSYVLQPYQMVKDLRTRHETGNAQAVLDGDLDDFIRAFLLHKAEGGVNRRVEDHELEDD